jgi:hypothetical protein
MASIRQITSCSWIVFETLYQLQISYNAETSVMDCNLLIGNNGERTNYFKISQNSHT